MRTVIIGAGNPLRGDDAVGLHVARALRVRMAGRTACDVVELWSGGPPLVEAMTGYARAVVVDAMTTQRAPLGTVRQLALEELTACRSVAPAEDGSLLTVLEQRRRAGAPVPGRVVVLGIEANDVDALTDRLSVFVASAVPRAVEAVLDELAAVKAA
jgi:hydrogenase maturation protease